jgi:hypothetical protein
MSNVSKLKGTKISINDDLTPEEQSVRKTIVAALKFARGKGVENCKVRRTGLLVNGHLVPVSELCNENWVENLAWLTNNESGETQPLRPAPTEKRSHEAIESPPPATFAEAVFFQTPRSNQQRSQPNAAGRGGRGRGQRGKKGAKTY